MRTLLAVGTPEEIVKQKNQLLELTLNSVKLL
jgi:hypothetical protein